ncbi:MAG: hypothetical protein WCP16_24080 [Pseudanabaena sp. ELA645]
MLISKFLKRVQDLLPMLLLVSKAMHFLLPLRQPRSAWTWEVELRPLVEKF